VHSRRKGALAVACALAFIAAALGADTARSEEPDDGAQPASPSIDWRRPPVNVRGGYTLERGQVVLAYRFERVGHSRLQNGRNEIAPESVLGAFTTAPETLDLDRHVFSALWSPIDFLTFQVELPYLRSVTDQVYDDAGTITGFETKSSGFGDVMLWVLYRVYRDDYSNLHLNLGLSFPSGSIAQAQVPDMAGVPSDELRRLAYPLQLGSGTVDLQPGFTYRGRYGDGAWGFQALAVLRAGTNEFDYILGNAYEAKAWGDYAWNEWLSNSFTLGWRQRFDGSGADDLIDPTSSPMADPELLAYRRLDALFGLAITPTGGRLARTRWALDAGLPAWQDLDGPQPRTKWLIQFALEVTI